LPRWRRRRLGIKLRGWVGCRLAGLRVRVEVAGAREGGGGLRGMAGGGGGCALGRAGWQGGAGATPATGGGGWRFGRCRRRGRWGVSVVLRWWVMFSSSSPAVRWRCSLLWLVSFPFGPSLAPLVPTATGNPWAVGKSTVPTGDR
jgi:hypothetical protein